MPLFVYRSSAGSGKTTALVNEYLKIALKDTANFKHILAITFTNKAANEMKERVLRALSEISSGDLKEGNNAYHKLFIDLDITTAQAVERAGELLNLILHNYDEFSISTIDSFIHRIVKTFASDVGLPKNFDVVVDDEDIIPDIVEELLSKVGSDEALTEVMVKFALSQAEEEKSYKVEYALYGFTKKQLDEENFNHLQNLDHISTKDFIKIIQILNKQRRGLKTDIRSVSAEAIKLIHANGLNADDLRHKRRGVYGYFVNCSKLTSDQFLEPNSYALDTVSNRKWTPANAKPSIMSSIQTIEEELIDAFMQIQELMVRVLRLNLIYRKIYSLALTNEIRKVFLSFTDRTQKVHISEFNKRLRKTIANQPVPFIYERLGRKYNYFLIDEFQDTSMLQWQNLLPLIEESLAYGKHNMLVGDAKQAIYRFRNGEVSLFKDLPEIYGKDGSPEMESAESLLRMHYKEIQLDNNWRSQRELVVFFNDFFEVLKARMDAGIKEIYANHVQQIPETKEKKGGFVSIGFIESTTKDDYKLRKLERIKSQIEQIMAVGYMPNDICILTRTNANAIEISSYLLTHGYNVVSSESLLLTSSPEIRMIISVFKLMLNPNEKLFLAELINNLKMIDDSKAPFFHDLISKSSKMLTNGINQVFQFLGLDLSYDEMIEMPVFETAEYLIRKLKLSNPTNIYVHFFLDFVLSAQEIGKTAYSDFLAHWDRKKSGLYITMPESTNAIKVMTIHKAKGLKFEAVIADLSLYNLKKTKTDLWVELGDHNFEPLPVSLLPLSGELKHIGLGHFVELESEKSLLDFINLVYVAFTRAVSVLFLTGHLENGQCKEKLTEYLQFYLDSKGLYKPDQQEYTFGELTRIQTEKEVVGTENVELQQSISNDWRDQVRIAEPDHFYWGAIGSKPSREYGSLIHKILSEIKYAKDISRVLRSYTIDGIIDDDECKSIGLILNRIVNHPELSEFYVEGITIRNEHEIFIRKEADTIVYRPDRIVTDGNEFTLIEYKTGTKESDHFDQITKYANALSELGFVIKKKLLVYILESNIELVAA